MNGGMNGGALKNIPDDNRLLKREIIEGIAQRIKPMARGGGAISLGIQGYWAGDLRWARNRVSLASDRRNLTVVIFREVRQSGASLITNQVDDASLEAAVRAAERMASMLGRKRPLPAFQTTEATLVYPSPTIWSDATSQATAETRAILSRQLAKESETAGMLSTGYLEMKEMEQAIWSDSIDQPEDGAVSSAKADWPGKGQIGYVRATQAQCSMTVRHPKGIGSGWAGLSSFDWARIDGPLLATRALEKCVMSLNPVAVEPGRYTVILEAQAVSDLVDTLWGKMARGSQEVGGGPFSRAPIPGMRAWTTKLGLKVMDERITISSDPNNLEQGVLPWRGLAPSTWIDRGVLVQLGYDRNYAIDFLRENLPRFQMGGYQMSGGTASMDDMIAYTKRGLVVTRFSNIQLVDPSSVLLTGYTRDGLWLVENGRISKAVKNLRFTESPLFVLNNVDTLGIPVPVFRPHNILSYAALTPAIVPPIKASNFSFTSIADAI